MAAIARAAPSGSAIQPMPRRPSCPVLAIRTGSGNPRTSRDARPRRVVVCCELIVQRWVTGDMRKVPIFVTAIVLATTGALGSVPAKADLVAGGWLQPPRIAPAPPAPEAAAPPEPAAAQPVLVRPPPPAEPA